jgi:hypothetical protein
MAANPILDAVKIQALVMIPVVKALEAELGKEKAHAIVGNAIAESWASLVASRTPARNTHPGEGRGDSGYPVDEEVVEHTGTTFSVNMTRCGFAEHFRKIGEPEIGALLTCGLDFAVERKLRPDWEFRRTQTRMEGAPFCDFRWRQRR